MAKARAVGWWLMAALVSVLLLWSLRYFVLGSDAYFERQRLVYEDKTFWLLLHIGGMMVAAAMGPLQFRQSFRDRHRDVHRLMGRIYVTGALVGGLGGLYMAQYAASGTVAHFGFTLLALGVLGASAMAYRAIRRRDIETHREWMTRSFALVLAAVTLRLYLPFLEAAFGEYDGYAAVAWLCWVPNILVAEWLIHRQRESRLRPGLAVSG